MTVRKARAIALYLPQFHPIPENDEWWGKGFTEWTNTAKARRLFPGHYQPHIPADLGFYDLRVPETRAAQADMARAHGVEGFCYYHYWFGGRRLLNRPFDEVVASGQPDFPFCVCWANETWTGVWHGLSNRVLIEQTYPGEDDHRAHFETLLPAFLDKRYIRVAEKPLFVIYKPEGLPGPSRTLDLWRGLAQRAGLPGLHIVANTLTNSEHFERLGFDAIMWSPPLKAREWRVDWRNPAARLRQSIETRLGRPVIHDYSAWVRRFWSQSEGGLGYPCVVHAWDNTPRSGAAGVVYKNPDPEMFRASLAAAFALVSKYVPDQRIVFLKSWNEWAEGNHLEPDQKYGMTFLDVVADVVRGG